MDADLASKPAQEKNIGPLGLALGLGIAAVGVAIGLLFLFAPTQTTQAVQEVVRAAQSLVKKDPPPAAVKEEQPDEVKPATFSRRKPRNEAVAAERPPAPAGGTEPASAQSVATQRRPPRRVDLPPGTARLRVRELLGEPDLALYKRENDHIVEHLVYVNRAQSYAYSVLLVDDRVTSVYSGVPLVSVSEARSERPWNRRSNN